MNPDMRDTLAFGLRELPRPPGHGYLYCRLSDSSREFILAFLDLYIEDPERLREIFSTSVRQIPTKTTLERDEVARLLASYSTENMRPSAEQILKQAVTEFVAHRSSPT